MPPHLFLIGLKVLAELHEQWDKLVRFFQMIANAVKVTMFEAIKSFKETVESGKELVQKGYSIKAYMRDMIYSLAMEASKVSYHVNRMCTVYFQVSDKYLMPQVSGLAKLIALDPSKDISQMEMLRQSLMDNCKETQNAILLEAKKSSKELKEIAEKRMKKLDQTLKALPAPPPEVAALEEGIVKAVKESLKEAEQLSDADAENCA